MAEIVLKNMYKRFDDFTAVKDLNLTIEDKEFLVLLGPSGCGKTTTLRCISGLELPSEGHILLGGEEVTNRRASQRDIAFVFQLYALYPHMTVFENIAFPLRTQKVSKKRIQKEVMQAAELLRIKHILNKKPKALSGGDQQRIALGRALVRRPKAFLLDEPIGTLDAAFREEMRTELKKLHVDIGATTVYVTHDQMEAMSMGDRIAVMNQAELQQVGEPHDVYANPKNLFVAQFIGSPGMNFLECKAAKDTKGDIALQMTSDGTVISVPKDIQNVLNSRKGGSGELILGVRPEDVLFSIQKKENHISTEVYAIEKMGSYNIVDVNYGTELLRVRTLPGIKVDYGTTVYATFDMERIRLFDKKSEENLIQTVGRSG